MLKSYFLIAVFLALAPMLARSEIPDLKVAAGSAARQGIVKLEWSNNLDSSSPIYELQEADDIAFTNPKIIYSGIDEGTFISGLTDGVYHYRLRSEDGSWSNTVTIEVNHHSLQLALILMAIGAIVFLITIAVIMQGRKNQETI